MKSSSSFSILMTFAVLTVVGFGLINRLSLQFLPSARAPSISVNYNWPNAAPEVLEREVTSPLEGAFSLIRGVRNIYSASGEGNGSIRLDVDEDISPDYLRFEIASKIRQLHPRLPRGLSFPVLQINRPEQDVAERPLLVYSLSGDDHPSELFRYALEQLNPHLALTSGLRTIEANGGNELEWLVEYDARQLEALKLDVSDLEIPVRQYFQTEALGVVRQGARRFQAQLRNRSDKDELAPAEWLEIPLQRIDGRLVRLGDVAKVRLAERPARAYYRINGRNSIRLVFYPERQVNTIRLARAIQGRVRELAASLPPGYRLHLEEDSTAYLREELAKIRGRTLLSLSLLLGFVLLTYRSLRYLAVVLLSLTANLGLAFIFYYLLGVEIHLYALAGITVSFGMVIDNTIVMAHHLRTHGNTRVFPALLSATLTTMAALVVIFFLPERWKANLSDFATVVMINLGVSLIVAILLVPVLLEKIALKEQKRTLSLAGLKRLLALSHLYEKLLAFLCRHRRMVIAATVLLFGLPVFLLPNQVEGWAWYNRTLGSDWYVEQAKPVVNRLFGGTLRLFAQYVYEGSAYREPDETVLYIQGSMPVGATLEQMNAVFRQVERYLAQFKAEVRQFSTQVSGGQFGMISVYFNSGYDLSFPYTLRDRMIAYSINLGGVKWNIYGVGKGFSNDPTGGMPRFRIRMQGYDKNELEKQANRFAEKLLAHPRIQEVNTDAGIDWWEKGLFQYELTLEPGALARRNISVQRLMEALRPFNRLPAYSFTASDNRLVRLVANGQEENDLWLLQHKTIQADDSTAVFFPELGTLEGKKVSRSLHKENQQYLKMVEFDYTGNAVFGQKYLHRCIEEMKREMPLGYTLEEQTWRLDRETPKLYGLLILVAALIFMICSIQFESLRQAMAVILLIPVSFIGIFLTFYGFDVFFDQGGYTSFIVVSGLAVNSLIFILNDRNGFGKKQPGRPDIQLYVKAFNHKIQPILLTVISTVLGFLPFLIVGNQDVFWYSLAAGVTGGLVFSLLVITLFCPVVLCRK